MTRSDSCMPQISKHQLSELALEAAIEVDNYISGQQMNAKSIRAFWDIIRNSIASDGAKSKIVDVTFVPIYNYALSSTLNKEFDDTQTLFDELINVLDEGKFCEDQSLKSPEVFRDFCLAIHNRLLGYPSGDEARQRVENQQVRSW